MKLFKLSKQEFGWVLYDWAFSAFAILQTAILPIYLKLIGKGIGLSNAATTSQWGLVQSVSTLIVALIAPVLGGIADYRGKKKILFTVFFVIAVLSLGTMVVSDNYFVLLLLNIVCTIGYSGTNIIYDAYLVDVAGDKRMNFISSLGFSVGYFGRCIPFLANILLVTLHPFGITEAAAIKTGIAITFFWWLVFTIPFLRNVRQIYGNPEKPKRIISASFKNVWHTLRQIIKERDVALFLIAYFFYIDGVNTMFTMSTDYGADLGISSGQMILALLLTQIVAFPSVLIFERIAKRTSTKKIILAAIAVFTLICLYAAFMSKAWQFWIMAVMTALVLGTIQALSRSYFGRILPDKNRNNEYFGFYSILGRYSSVIGPLLISLFTILTGSSRYGVLSLVALFIIGFAFFTRVRDIDVKPEKQKSVRQTAEID